MTISLDDWEDVKRKVDRAKKAADKTQGAFEQVMATILEEFGCKDLAAAEKEVERLQEEETAGAAVWNKKLKRFKEDNPTLFPDG